MSKNAQLYYDYYYLITKSTAEVESPMLIKKKTSKQVNVSRNNNNDCINLTRNLVIFCFN